VNTPGPVSGDPQFARTPANGCRACGFDFASLRAFDAHWRRWPEHRRGEPLPFDEDDFRTEGFVQNRFGRWSLGRTMPGAVRRVLSGTGQLGGTSL
jgi:hypothetical protein